MKRTTYTALTVVAVFLIPGGIPSSDARGPPEGLLASLSFEDSTWAGSTTCGDHRCDLLHDPESGNNFRVIKQGALSGLRAWISSSEAEEGRKSLGVSLASSDEKQRVEFEISGRRYFPQTLGMARYYGMAIYIDPESQDALKKPIFFMQAWQVHDTSLPKFPPFSLLFEAGTGYKWSVLVARDSAGDTRGATERIYTSDAGLKKGRWYEFDVLFKPSVRKDGALTVWFEGAKVVEAGRKNFGYQPRTARPAIRNFFQVRFGAYRGAGEEPGDVTLMFDEAKFATGSRGVDP